jgi:hypothetical protein
MSDLDEWISVIVVGALVLIPARAWIERRIRSERARRIVLTATWIFALAAVAVWLVRFAMFLMA